MSRDYKREYQQYHARPAQKKRRAQRNASRKKMQDVGRVHKGDGKDVHHKDRNPANNSAGNLRVQSKAANRSRNSPRTILSGRSVLG